LPLDVVDYEISLMKDLGVKIVTNQALDADNGVTIQSLRKEGYEAFFIGIGAFNCYMVSFI
jgi:NADPH-dependent glutamate synthase beta subunit-like oxidoreductase